jgi:hypothetical protein
MAEVTGKAGDPNGKINGVTGTAGDPNGRKKRGRRSFR